MTSPSSLDGLFSQLQIDNHDQMSPAEIVNIINDSFLDPMKEYSPLSECDVQSLIDSSEDVSYAQMNLTTPESVYNQLKSLNPGKAPGPDGIANWVWKDYANILASPISALLNDSYIEQKLPLAWKQANITPIPKETPVTNINNHLRPISLTAALSKIAEDFIVETYIAPAILNIIDLQQFGGIPRSSAILALINMVHEWSKATDGTGDTIRVAILDYRKAFDLIDHRILAQSVFQLQITLPVKKWVVNFLMDREQRVKLSRDCFSEWRGFMVVYIDD